MTALQRLPLPLPSRLATTPRRLGPRPWRRWAWLDAGACFAASQSWGACPSYMMTTALRLPLAVPPRPLQLMMRGAAGAQQQGQPDMRALLAALVEPGRLWPAGRWPPAGGPAGRWPGSEAVHGIHCSCQLHDADSALLHNIPAPGGDGDAPRARQAGCLTRQAHRLLLRADEYEEEGEEEEGCGSSEGEEEQVGGSMAGAGRCSAWLECLSAPRGSSVAIWPVHLHATCAWRHHAALHQPRSTWHPPGA